MDITNFTKQQGQFLKAIDVEQSPTKIFVISEEGQTVHNDKYDTDRLHITGCLDEVTFVFDCSKTNARVIADKIGNDTKLWIGKKLVLETYKTKTTEGKMTSAINVSKAE